jgi:hypothetical protein
MRQTPGVCCVRSEVLQGKIKSGVSHRGLES